MKRPAVFYNVFAGCSLRSERKPMEITVHTMEYHGGELLMFAVACMQKRNTAPIRLHVADWNRRAVKLYQSCGFEITETRTIG